MRLRAGAPSIVAASRMLGETSRQEPPQPLAKRPRIRGAIAVEHARFIEQQVCGILLEGEMVIAQ